MSVSDAAIAAEPHVYAADRAPSAPYGARLALTALSIGGLALGTGEFAAMGVLPDVAADVEVSIPTAGHMISAYALGVVVGAPLLAVLFAKAPRRALLVWLMLFFALGNLASAFAPGYLSLNAGRFVAGLPHGAYFGVAALVAASLVAPNKRAQAVSNVMLGLSAANVVGVPAATWLGQAFGWRATFMAVAALGLITAALVRVFLPAIAAAEGASARRELGAFAKPQVWFTLGVAAVGFGGMFAVYSYITPTLTEVTGLPVGLVPVMLAVLGLGMIAGNIVGGMLADRALKATILGTLVWSAVVIGAFVYGSATLWTATINLFLIGACIAIGPALQTRLMDVAADAQTLAAALNHSAFNLANAIGAWLGGVAIAAGLGWTAPGWVGAGLALGGLALAVTSFWYEKRDARQAASAR